MKKWLSFLLVPVFLTLLLSCDTDPYRGKRPIDAPDSYWECTFGKKFEIKVDSVGDNWSILSDDLTFERME